MKCKTRNPKSLSLTMRFGLSREIAEIDLLTPPKSYNVCLLLALILKVSKSYY